MCEEVGCRPSEPLDSLIGGMLANQCVCGGAEYCVRFVFLCTPFCHFLFSCFGVLARELCVCLVTPRCTFTMQLFLYEIVKFSFLNFSGPLVQRLWHKSYTLIASRTSAERPRNIGARSTSKRCVQCNFSAKWVRQEATEWSDKGSWLLVSVWAVCGGLNNNNNNVKYSVLSVFSLQSLKHTRWLIMVCKIH